MTRDGVLGQGIARRTFLGIAGMSAAGLLVAPGVLAAQRGTTPAAGAPPAQEAPPDPFDTVASALDYDQDAIFRFVADEIAYEPYPGVLRGAEGTLAARAGNAADKALLLAALLDRSLLTTRFVTGTLDETGTDALRAAAQAELATIQARATEVIQRPLPDPLGGGAAGAGAPPLAALPAEAQAYADAQLAASDQRAARVTALLAAGTRTITDALADAGIAIPDAPDPFPALEHDRHAWLQVQVGPDWVDLDPSVPGTEPGTTLAAAADEPADTLPDDLRHQVTFRVVVERIAGDGLEQVPILEVTHFADEITGRPMALTHETPDGLKGIGVGIGDALAGTRQYQPVLQVGDNATIGLTGVAFPDGTDGGGLSGTLGATGRDGEATAEWLEVTTTGPDGTASSARRVLFDRFDPAARASGQLDVAGLPAPEFVDSAGGPTFPAMQALHFLAVAGGATTTALIDALPDDADGSAWPLHLAGHLYHLARDGANAAIAAAQGVRLFHDRPNVVRYTVEPAGDDPTIFRAALDILHRGFGALPVVGVEMPAAPGILAGVLSQAVEQAMFEPAGSADAAATDATDRRVGVSVGAVLEAAATQEIPVAVVRPGDALPDGLPAEAAATLGEAQAAGLVAIGPASPVQLAGASRIGWWLFDPATGAVTDRMDDGRGVEMVERALLAIKTFLQAHPYIKLGLCIVLLVKTLAGMLQALSGGSPLMFVVGLAGALSPINAIACG
ncbi:MAG: transglutaminase domain-containing protein [Chloroflexota bacterium]